VLLHRKPEPVGAVNGVVYVTSFEMDSDLCNA
jgi:hypothetical protein